MKNRAEERFHILFHTGDALLRERVLFHFRSRGNITFTFPAFSSSIPPHLPADLIVVPAQDLPDSQHKHVPCIAYGSPQELPSAYLKGCDDFLKEPWTPEELRCRISRFFNPGRISCSWGDIIITPGEASSPVGTVPLSIQEYRLLTLLIRYRGQTVYREALFYILWGRTAPTSRAVDMHISSLRQKLKQLVPDSQKEPLIRTIRGIGYFIP